MTITEIQAQISLAKQRNEYEVYIYIPGKKSLLIEALLDLGYNVRLRLTVRDLVIVSWKN